MSLKGFRDRVLRRLNNKEMYVFKLEDFHIPYGLDEKTFRKLFNGAVCYKKKDSFYPVFCPSGQTDFFVRINEERINIKVIEEESSENYYCLLLRKVGSLAVKQDLHYLQQFELELPPEQEEAIEKLNELARIISEKVEGWTYQQAIELIDNFKRGGFDSNSLPFGLSPYAPQLATLVQAASGTDSTSTKWVTATLQDRVVNSDGVNSLKEWTEKDTENMGPVFPLALIKAYVLPDANGWLTEEEVKKITLSNNDEQAAMKESTGTKFGVDLGNGESPKQDLKSLSASQPH